MKDHAEKIIFEEKRNKSCGFLEYGIKIYACLFLSIYVDKYKVKWKYPVYLRGDMEASVARAK